MVARAQSFTAIGIAGTNPISSDASSGGTVSNLWASMDQTISYGPPYMEGPPPGHMVTPPHSFGPTQDFYIIGTVSETTYSSVPPDNLDATLYFGVTASGYEHQSYEDMGPTWNNMSGTSVISVPDAILNFSSFLESALPTFPTGFSSNTPDQTGNATVSGVVSGWVQTNYNPADKLYTWSGTFQSTNNFTETITGLTAANTYNYNTCESYANTSFSYTGEAFP